jgi:hypothetical protein
MKISIILEVKYCKLKDPNFNIEKVLSHINSNIKKYDIPYINDQSDIKIYYYTTDGYN